MLRGVMADADPQDALVGSLAALASPIRWSILRQVRVPRVLSEIEVRGERGGVERTLSRQAIREHLDHLIGAGVVVAREGKRAFGATQEFIVNHQAIYALAEELKQAAGLRGLAEPDLHTRPLARPQAEEPSGPRLVIAKGLDEGRTFALTPTQGRTEWIVGRRRGVDIALDFDPYVSSENTLIRGGSGRFSVVDLRGSTNGTTVNFVPIEKGGERPLSHGDLIGVGRSALLFWSDGPR